MEHRAFLEADIADCVGSGNARASPGMKWSSRKLVTAPRVERSRSERYLRTVLEAAAILLTLAAVVVWCLPPKPSPHPSLPDNWTPGCPELQVQWRVLEDDEGHRWSHLPEAVTGDGFLLRSYQIENRADVHHIRMDGTVQPLIAPDEEPIFNLLPLDDSIWGLQRLDGRLGLLEFDAATGALRRRLLYPPAEEQPIQHRFSTWDPLPFPDGSIGIVCFINRSTDCLLRLEPDTGDISAVPLPDSVVSHFFWVHPTGLLVASRWRTRHVVAIDPRTGQEVPLPGDLTENNPMENWASVLRVETAPPPVLRDEHLQRKSLSGYANKQRRRLWIVLQGGQRTIDQLAATHRVSAVLAPDSFEGTGSKTWHPLEGDLAATVAANTRLTGRFGGQAMVDTATVAEVLAGSVDLQLKAETKLWTATIEGRQRLVVQQISPTPSTINDGRGLLRFGVLHSGDRAVRWRGWLAIPPLFHDHDVRWGVASTSSGLVLVGGQKFGLTSGAAAWCVVPGTMDLRMTQQRMVGVPHIDEAP